ncbi:MAG TPA: hypothetical protein VGT60_02910 [Candidatus Limnocylindria bacterium]|nr:hypothetical protein [Candidatus Limnocylindria bacterium]
MAQPRAAHRYADGATVQLTRDAVGNRVGMVDAVGTTTYASTCCAG